MIGMLETEIIRDALIEYKFTLGPARREDSERRKQTLHKLDEMIATYKERMRLGKYDR